MYGDANLSIDVSISRGASPGEYLIKAFFSNNQAVPLSAVTLQVAVQKYMRLTLQNITQSEIPPGSRQQVTQDMNIVNTQDGAKPLSVKIRVAYTMNGQNIVETKIVNNLAPTQ